MEHEKVIIFVLLFLYCCTAIPPDNEELRKAIRRLLTQHEVSPFDPVENNVARTRTSACFPSAESYVLPRVIIWDPFVQLSHNFAEVNCPRCEENTNFLRAVGWKDGRLQRDSPRSIYGNSGIVLIISRKYCCRKGHEIAGHDQAILDMFPVKSVIPFILTHKSGVTTELMENLVSMIRNGLSFVQVQGIMEERLYMKHLNAEGRFLEDLHNYSQTHPVVYETSFTEFSSSNQCPSRNFLTNIFIYYFDKYESLLVDRMASLTTTESGWLSCDHTFEVTNSIGYERPEDKKWVKQFETLFCVLNENGQVLTWQLCETQGFDKIEELLKRLSQRLSAQGKVVNEFYIDNCCHWRKKLQSVFGTDLLVKLDIFHAVQRITAKIPKKHPFHWKCIQDLRMIFRDPTDHGEIRTKSTPDPETLLKNAHLFIKKWSNVEDNGNPVLSDVALKELENLKEHMKKGCLSGKQFNKNY